MSDKKWTISTGGGYEPRWRGDGGEIYYLSEDRKLMAVSVGAGPSFGVPKPLFQTRVPAGVSSYRTHYVPRRDGQRFLVNTQSGDPAPIPITIVLNWFSISIMVLLGSLCDMFSPIFSPAQYRVPSAAMPFRHNGREQWNFGISDTLWRWRKR